MNQKHQEDLAHIRSMMERSSRFISLSGLSGVFAGLSALIGGIYVYQLFKVNGIEYFTDEHVLLSGSLVSELIWIGVVILVCAFVFGTFLPLEKAKNIIYQFGLLPQKICCLIWQFHLQQEEYFV